MKKIILGCAAVLLSLGLLAGCNNKEDEPPITEAVSLSVSQTSVNLEPGGSATVTYTVSPEKATVMALSDHEEYVTAVAQEGTIYLEAVAAGTAIVSVGAEYEDYASAQASITVTVSEVLEPEPVVPTVSLTLTKSTLNLVLPEEQSGETGAEVIEYTVTPSEEEGTEVVMEVTSSTPTNVAETEAVVTVSNLADGWTVTPQVPGTAEITVTATCKDYEPAEATIEVTVHEEGWEPQSLTYKITLGSLGAAPEGTSLYAAGDFNGTWNPGDGNGWYDWGEPVELVSNEDATYNLELDFLPENNRSFEILATNLTYDNDATEDRWNHVIGSYTITGISDESNGTTIDITISTTYDGWESGENPVFKALGEDETIYVVFLDDGKEADKVTAESMGTETYTVVDNKGNATFKEGATSCTPTMTTTTNSTRVAFYTEEVTVPANAVVEFDLYVTVSDYTHHLTSPDLTVPEAEEGKINVLVLGSPFNGWLSDTTYLWWNCVDDSGDYASSGLGWQTMESFTTISTFVNSITYTNPWEAQ